VAEKVPPKPTKPPAPSSQKASYSDDEDEEISQGYDEDEFLVDEGKNTKENPFTISTGPSRTLAFAT